MARRFLAKASGWSEELGRVHITWALVIFVLLNSSTSTYWLHFIQILSRDQRDLSALEAKVLSTHKVVSL